MPINRNTGQVLISRITAELLRRGRSRPKHLDRDRASALASQIAQHVDQYFEMRRRLNNPAARAVEAWLVRAAERVEALNEWIARGPKCPCGEPWAVGTAAEHECPYADRLNPMFFAGLDEARARVITALHGFRQWLDTEHSGNAFPANRPTDIAREDLECGVAHELNGADVPLRTGREGVFGRVLMHVYDAAGIEAAPDAALVKVLDLHPEWRR